MAAWKLWNINGSLAAKPDLPADEISSCQGSRRIFEIPVTQVWVEADLVFNKHTGMLHGLRTDRRLRTKLIDISKQLRCLQLHRAVVLHRIEATKYSKHLVGHAWDLLGLQIIP